jgi:hypothetical protein
MSQESLGSIIFIALAIIIILPILRYHHTNRKSLIWKFLNFRLFKGKKVPGNTAESSNSPNTSRERNGNKDDLYITSNAIINLVKINKWFIIIPGALVYDSSKLNLSGIVITQKSIIGFKCYGFGGQVKENGQTWNQTINGMHRSIVNIREECITQEKILKKFSTLCGQSTLSVEVCAIFTTPGVTVNCDTEFQVYDKDSFADHLMEEKTSVPLINPKDIGKQLNKYLVNSKR